MTLNELVGAAAVWKFDEGSGTNTADFSGSGNVGALVNGPVWATGENGGALNFAAATSYVSVANSSTLNNLYASGHGMTVTAWIKPAGTGGGGGGRIVDKDNNNGGWFLRMNNSGTSVQFAADQFEPSGMIPAAAATRNSADSIVLNTWQHVAVTWDGSTDALNHIHIFINAVASDGSSTNGSGVAAPDDTTPFTIGNRTLDKARNFNGSIDGLRVYNRQLTPAEIQSLVNAGL